VVASLVFRAAEATARDPAAPWRRREHAARARRFVAPALSLLVDPGRTPAQAPPPPRWAIGLITAPRPEPTIETTLRSAGRAGFGPVHIFAEPGSLIPESARHLPCTRHGQTLGNLGNFYAALAGLFLHEPTADRYLVLQDDLELAAGLRAWCDSQPWPLDAGVISLYTCGAIHADEPGWRLVATGRHHTFGALAFVFRRDALREFLGDGRLLEYREQGVRSGSDGVVGEWAARRGVGIAYHTPSLVDHIGATSSLAAGGSGHGIAGPLTTTRAVRDVGDLAAWAAPPRRLGRVGLVGWDTASGLGYLNRALAAKLPVDRWLVPPHPRFPTLPPPAMSGRVDHVPPGREPDDAEMLEWLRGLDWLLFAEHPGIPGLVPAARGLGVRVACVPMWEYTDPRFDWVQRVNLMLCPTRHSADLFADWKRRFGFAWDVQHVAWPIDAGEIPFRRRTTCRRFVFLNGTGGAHPRRVDGTVLGTPRKGLDIVLEAARLLHPIPFLVHSQVDSPFPIPANVEFRPGPADNRRLYDEGDVCVQPSRWEGLGLSLLECQAAGLPLVTTDAPPMNEAQPLATAAAPDKELVYLTKHHAITSHNVSPRDLAEVLRGLHAADVGESSGRARAFIEREHSWERALPVLARALHA
jgi:glycosyltransferase involved in cell wall biosynthesis